MPPRRREKRPSHPSQRPIPVDRGQTETIGVVLLLAMTIIGTSAVVAFGGTALDEAKLVSQNRGTAHTMTQFDSRAALVALGDSDVQTISLGNSGGGSYYVDSDAGWINISHYNRSGNGDAEEILNESLGTVVYETPDSVIAYQGGGVWQGTGENSTMVSPPEFHYRAATLTFPLIRVVGNGSASGRIEATITPETRGIRVYPDAGRTYSVGPADPYQNPIQEGEVRVTIHSVYYKAWAEYFRTRSSGEVRVFDNNDTVELTLLSKGTLGDFDMPSEGNAVQVRGLGDSHQLTNFTITIVDDEEDSADFANLKWSIYAEKGGQRFEIHIRNEDDADCGDSARVTIYYSDDSHGSYQAFTNGSAFQYECEGPEDFNDDGDTNDKRLVANFTGDTPVEYEPIKEGDGAVWTYKGDVPNNGLDDPITWDQHPSAGEPMTFDHDGSPEETSIDNVTNHYLSLMSPNVDLRIDDFPGNSVNEEASTGTLEQDSTGGKFLTFLHITENRIDVEFE